MVMGKGGVGKTTVAAAVAVELASRGVPVHLTTTDPAAHLADTLRAEVPGLRVTRIESGSPSMVDSIRPARAGSVPAAIL